MHAFSCIINHTVRKIAILFIFLVFILSPTGVLAWAISDSPISYSLFANVNTYPYQMALNSSGNLFVTITGDSSLSKFDSNGNLISSFGSAFSGPTGVAIASNGNIYVANTQQDKIEIYTSGGTFVSSFGTTGSGNNQFSAPYSIAFDSQGNIFIADAGNNRVQKFDSSFNYLSTITGSGGAFNYPEAVAIDSSNNLYVLDSTNNRVQVFNSSGTFIRTTVGSGGAWNYPEGMTVDTDGNLYVADSGNDRIQIFDSSGSYQQQFGTSGTGLGQFQYPTGLIINSSGVLFIGDQDRIQKVVFDRLPASVTISSYTDNKIIGTVTDSLSTLTSIEFSLNGGNYQACQASDGVIDELTESFYCSLGVSLPIGDNTVTVRATDSKTNTNSGNNLGSYTIRVNPNPVSPPVCTNLPPQGIPKITKIDRNLGTAIITFEKIQNSEEYVIEYGTKMYGEYAAHISPSGPGSIHYLNDNENYYFRLRGGNSCATGMWSDWFLSAGIKVRATIEATPVPATNKESAKESAREISNDSSDVEVDETKEVSISAILITGAGILGGFYLLTKFLITSISISSSLGFVYKNTRRSVINAPLDFSFAMIGWIKSVVTVFPFMRKNTKGVVFDSITYKPVTNALMLFFSDSGNLKSTYSNFDGKYEIRLNPDEYKIRIDKDKYIFPSNTIKVIDNGYYTNIYIHPEKIPVNESQKIINHISIPLDPAG